MQILMERQYQSSVSSELNKMKVGKDETKGKYLESSPYFRPLSVLLLLLLLPQLPPSSLVMVLD